MNMEEKITIYMVEDDEGHARLIEKNLRRAGITNDIVHFDNGRKVIDHLLTPGSKSQHPQGTLILLDLNLPEIDGYEVLARLKQDDRTKAIPIIILTTTDNPREIERCYDMGCNVYVTKPVEYEAFSEAIRKLGLLLAIVKLPAGA
jgi:CheY-like chemotaxis protein